MNVLISNISDISYLTGLIYNEGNAGGIFLLLDLDYSSELNTDFVINECNLFLSELLYEQIKFEFEQNLPIISYLEKSKINLHKINEKNPLSKKIKIKNLFPVFNDWLIKKREIKTSQEIKALKQASLISFRIYQDWLNLLKPGLSELKAKLLLEELILTSQNNSNSHSLAFPVIVAFNKNCRFPHHNSNNQTILKEGDTILVDWGIRLNNYCSDHTRTFVFKGKSNESIKKIEFIHNQIIEYVNSVSSVNNPLKYSELNNYCMKLLGQNKKFMTHSLGHGIGIEVHESPHFSSENSILKSGHAITIEPGTYTSEYGARYENTYLINSENKLINTLDL